MLSIEEIKLLIEKLEKVKKEDLQELINTNLRILKDVALAVDANNKSVINRLDKTPEWFEKDLAEKKVSPTQRGKRMSGFCDPSAAKRPEKKRGKTVRGVAKMKNLSPTLGGKQKNASHPAWGSNF